jgi:hypothetical protein
MAWVPLAAVLWALVYGSVRIWWAIHGAPGTGPLNVDLLAFTGWRARRLRRSRPASPPRDTMSLIWRCNFS